MTQKKYLVQISFICPSISWEHFLARRVDNFCTVILAGLDEPSLQVILDAHKEVWITLLNLIQVEGLGGSQQASEWRLLLLWEGDRCAWALLPKWCCCLTGTCKANACSDCSCYIELASGLQCKDHSETAMSVAPWEMNQQKKCFLLWITHTSSSLSLPSPTHVSTKAGAKMFVGINVTWWIECGSGPRVWAPWCITNQPPRKFHKTTGRSDLSLCTASSFYLSFSCSTFHFLSSSPILMPVPMY